MSTMDLFCLGPTPDPNTGTKISTATADFYVGAEVRNSEPRGCVTRTLPPGRFSSLMSPLKALSEHISV